MVSRFWLVSLATLGAASVVTPSWAQKKESNEASEASAETESAESDEAGTEKADDAGDEEKPAEKGSDESKKDEDSDGDEKKTQAGDESVVEEKGKTYHFVGARYRLIVVPKFMMNLFGDGGATVAVHSFGPEFAIRKDGFEYDFAVWFAGYGMDRTAFKSKSDGEEAWELVESNIKVLYLTADFLWSHSFTPNLALNYGMGAGFGFVFGALKRTQAYKDPTTGDYSPCRGEFDPPFGASTGIVYCNNDNDHYRGYEEPSWANGGSKPVIFPWLALQTGVRYKAHRNFVARFDTGFGLSGFFFGLGADYGL